ncbi:hypothetical protein TWF225_009436 [Orbilia oligospora]|nr:hypothetical protein TWF225_009436 [Orbilia oligospora]KAF3259420.1 hypothetical protein TWF217_005118 [Orbilia oligospora]KAF3263902.1 hypothetical protein TWF128_001538 [Orbilia oligospora]KAF3290191.1 hypothetical protein TWF132_007190 [Orbilia oligospora]
MSDEIPSKKLKAFPTITYSPSDNTFHIEKSSKDNYNANFKPSKCNFLLLLRSSFSSPALVHWYQERYAYQQATRLMSNSKPPLVQTLPSKPDPFSRRGIAGTVRDPLDVVPCLKALAWWRSITSTMMIFFGKRKELGIPMTALDTAALLDTRAETFRIMFRLRKREFHEEGILLQRPVRSTSKTVVAAPGAAKSTFGEHASFPSTTVPPIVQVTKHDNNGISHSIPIASIIMAVVLAQVSKL